MSWRLARSLEVLEAEVQALHPGTTVWDLGDPEHQQTWSDHNPNAAGVVCAIDVLGDAGLDLDEFAATITETDPPALKYVIYDRRIASAGAPWRPYYGSNPHTGHVHVSVGVGPDGRSTGPYDDTSPWGLIDRGGVYMGHVGLKHGDNPDPKNGGNQQLGWRVQSLQATLRHIAAASGQDDIHPGEVDGWYGDSTAAAVLACRRSMGSSAESGETVTGWADAQIRLALTRAESGEGGRGKPGPPPSDEQVAAAVDGWMDEHREELRGPAGEIPEVLEVEAVRIRTRS